MRLSLSAEGLITFGLYLIFYTGFQGGRYFMDNRLQELGLMAAVGLFLYSAIVANLNIRDRDLRWNWWFFMTIGMVLYTFILPAYRFSVNAGVSMIPSVFASREFLIIFLSAAMWFLYRLGYPIEKFEKIFIVSLVILAFNYLFHYFRMDLRAAYFSSDYILAALVTFDPWRGYRLKPSTTALFTLTLLAPYMLYLAKGLWKKIQWTIVLGVVGYIWALVQARSMAVTLIMGATMFPFFFSKRSRMGLFYFSIPMLLGMFIFLIYTIVMHMLKGDENEQVRLRSLEIAWNSIQQTPFLGFGQQSNFTITEQEIFWYKFFSADLGLVGITFKYGFIGASVYVFMMFFLLQRVIRANWLYQRAYKRNNPIYFAILSVWLAYLINITLNPSLAFINGLTLAAFTIGLTACWKHRINTEFKAVFAREDAARMRLRKRQKR
jgi:hypothetical protein